MGLVRTYRRLLGNGPLSRLLLGEFISLVGDRMYLVALLVLIYRETHDAAVLAVIGAVRLVPYLVLSIPAGVVADRFDRRYVLLASDIGRGVCMLVLAALVMTGGSIVAIGATALVAGSFTPFFHPAFRALVPSLVRDESEFGPTNSAWSTLDSLSMVVGPALAGLVIAVASVEVAFILNAATFGLVAVILLSLAPARARPIEPAEATPIEPRTRRGARVRDVVNLPAVAGVLSLEAVAGMAFGALDILAVILAIDVFRGGDAATGYLTAAIGVGGVIGSLAAGAVVLGPRLRPAIVGSVALFSASLVVLGVAPDLTIAFLAIMLVASGNMVLDVIRMTIFQRVVPDAYRGRFGGLMMTTGVAAEALGVLVVPILAVTLGLPVVLNLLALGTIGATGLGLILIGAAASRDVARQSVAAGAGPANAGAR